MMKRNVLKCLHYEHRGYFFRIFFTNARTLIRAAQLQSKLTYKIVERLLEVRLVYLFVFRFKNK